MYVTRIAWSDVLHSVTTLDSRGREQFWTYVDPHCSEVAGLQSVGARLRYGNASDSSRHLLLWGNAALCNRVAGYQSGSQK